VNTRWSVGMADQELPGAMRGRPRPGAWTDVRSSGLGSNKALDTSQKANSKLACATNFPVDANDTRASVKADALPKRSTSALTK
jgi:hypothetical protein